MTTEPTLRILSLGAGVQSSALLIMAARGDLPKPDAAIFADTGWEPAAVYEHLDRLEREIAKPAGIPIYRVRSGNIRSDALNPTKRFATMPLFIKSTCPVCNGTKHEVAPQTSTWETDPEDPDSTNAIEIIHEAYDGPCRRCNATGITQGIARRQCTSEYKLKPIKRKVRELLGYPHPKRIPPGVYAEQWIGISTDEKHRAYEADGVTIKTGDVNYSFSAYPLLGMDMSRDKCRALLNAYGFGKTPKSACIGCPFHTNAHWRQIRRNPDDWADAVAFDASIRAGSARATALGKDLRGEAYLHRSMVPLDQAPIDWDNSREWARQQTDVISLLSVSEYEERLSDEERDSLTGCSILEDCTKDEEEQAA